MCSAYVLIGNITLNMIAEALKRVLWSGAVESVVAMTQVRSPDVTAAAAGFLYQVWLNHVLVYD